MRVGARRCGPTTAPSSPGSTPWPTGSLAIAGPDAFHLSTPRAIARRGRHGRGRVPRRRGRARALRPDLAPVPRCRSPTRWRAPTRRWRAREAWWRDWSGRCTYDGDYPDAVRTLAGHLKALTYEPPAASSPRRPPRCPRTSAACATGTTATAGCATRCSRCEALLRAATRTRRWPCATCVFRAVAGRPGQPPDHVRARRRAAADRVRAAVPARLRGLEPGARRQRGVGAVPARRLRRGDGGRATPSWSAGPAARPTAFACRAGAPWSSSSRRCGASPTTASGRRAGRGATSPTPR